VLTVDDDNRPGDAYFRSWLSAAFNSENVVSTTNRFFDPGALCEPKVIARGVPYPHEGQFGDRFTTTAEKTPDVIACLWKGEPDVDAVQRLINPTQVQELPVTVTINCKGYFPINSQATCWTRDWAPLMAVLPRVGRMDDIWASFIAERIMREYGAVVQFSARPFVIQDRNEHDIIKDLKAELIGIKYSRDLCDALEIVDIGGLDPLEAYAYVSLRLRSYEWFPWRTGIFMSAWLVDVKEAMA
jgi:hypothetical protein